MEKKCTKKVCYACKVVLLLISVVVFSPFSLPSPLSIVSVAAVFSIVTQRSAPGALRYDTKKGSEGDYA